MLAATTLLAADPPAGSHAHTNRLIRETSPYLLQHAHNPVDWYAWGPEAFEAARAADKPIFLESMSFPEPVLAVSIEPKTKADQEKLAPPWPS